MKFLVSVALALVLLTVESVLVKYLGLSVTRIDATVVLLVFLALRATLLESAFAAFAVGYLLDVMSGQPTGLYIFLAVLTVLVARLAASLVDVRSRASFVLFTIAAELGHTLFALFLTWMTSKYSEGLFSVGSFLAQMLLCGLVAMLLFPLLKRFESSNERSEFGLLR